jgi:hypothetical protein
MGRQPPVKVVLMNTNEALPFWHGRVLEWGEWMEVMSHFGENRARFPGEQQLPYMGKIIAWEPDGSAIRESGSNLREVFDKIKAQGDDTQVYVYEDILDLYDPTCI